MIIDTTSNIGCIIGVNGTLITTNNDTTISKVSIIYIIMSLLNYVVINDSTDEFFQAVCKTQEASNEETTFGEVGELKPPAMQVTLTKLTRYQNA